MGFLDHSTNNVIIDAVLTDMGRRMLADNQGRFRISFFSLADDEVDYTIIKKFGRAVGKEKINKNTPIFEAQTLGSNALKYRMLTLPDPTVLRLPKITLTSTAADNNSGILQFGTEGSNIEGQTSVTVEQTVEGALRIPDGVSDVTFTVLLPDRFLRMGNRQAISVEATTRIAMYSITRSNTNGINGAIAQFTLAIQGGLDDTIFTIYGKSNNKDVISSVCSVIGDQSGIRKDFTVEVIRP